MKRVRDTDETSQKKRNMRIRFKRLVRAVMLNQQWLDEPDDQGQALSMNVKKNVAFLVRQKRKTGLLTVAEKAMLRSPHFARTIEERKKLCMIVANLTCFSKIPPKLRARLAQYLKFETINKGRVIIREGTFPIFIYFMISGEVEMKKNVYDKSTKTISMISEAILGPGDWLGEVEVMEDCPRLNTYVTLSPCELLTVSDDEFKKVLGPFMKKQWLQKKLALKSLNYFDFLTNEQIVRACSYCHLTQYDPLQSIYSEDGGAISCVHFILSGECVVLQCLKMKVEHADGKNTFELTEVDMASQSLFNATSRSWKSLETFQSPAADVKILSNSVFNIQELLASTSESDDEETLLQKKAMRKMGLREIEAACGYGIFNMREVIKKAKTKLRSVTKRRTTVIPRLTRRTILPPSFSIGEDDEQVTEEISEEFDYIDEDYIEEEEVESETEYEVITVKSSGRNSSVKSGEQVKLSVRIEDDSEVIENDLSSSESESISEKTSLIHVKPPNKSKTETHFIDVGSLTYGGIFGLGEKMAHRVIMARTVVQCLLLPRYWLLQEEQNPGNVWQRRKFYLENSIPSREELFGNFLNTRRWEKFKVDYVQSTLNPHSANSTQREDIPIICRIVETRDDIK